jgi:alpha-tubulin suppressor-like RCC1 family protein
LGVGHANHVTAIAPEEVKGGLSGQGIKKICGGWTHTLAVTESGLLYSWGGGHSVGFPLTYPGICDSYLSDEMTIG